MPQSNYQTGYEDGKRAARDELIEQMHERGMSQREIAQYVYISRQRVNQILNKESSGEQARA